MVIYLYAYILRFLLFNYGTYFLTFVRSLGHRDQVQVLENRYTQVSKVLGIQLFKSFEFGNGSRMSDKNLVILEFKYLQNKIWQKQAVKTASYLQLVIEHNDYFHFTQITDKNLQFSFKNWQFSMFTAFMKLRGFRFLYFFSLCDIRNEAVFLLLKHSCLKGVKQK